MKRSVLFWGRRFSLRMRKLGLIRNISIPRFFYVRLIPTVYVPMYPVLSGNAGGYGAAG